jgi:hypothetical protein
MDVGDEGDTHGVGSFRANLCSGGVTARTTPHRRRPLAPTRIPEPHPTAPCTHDMVGWQLLASLGG